MLSACLHHDFLVVQSSNLMRIEAEFVRQDSISMLAENWCGRGVNAFQGLHEQRRARRQKAAHLGVLYHFKQGIVAIRRSLSTTPKV